MGQLFLALYCGIATVPSSVPKEGKNGHGLKLQCKSWANFLRFNFPSKIISKKILRLVLPNEICFIYSSEL